MSDQLCQIYVASVSASFPIADFSLLCAVELWSRSSLFLDTNDVRYIRFALVVFSWLLLASYILVGALDVSELAEFFVRARGELFLFFTGSQHLRPPTVVHSESHSNRSQPYASPSAFSLGSRGTAPVKAGCRL